MNETRLLDEKTYTPQGSTNLYDAIGKVMSDVNESLKTSTKRSGRDSVSIVILTDGEENTSRTYNNTDIKRMIEQSESKEWSFMFLGANIDAFAVGSSLGFSSHNTLQYSTKNMENTMRVASRMAGDMSNMKFRGLDSATAYAEATFSEEERDSTK